MHCKDTVTSDAGTESISHRIDKLLQSQILRKSMSNWLALVTAMSFRNATMLVGWSLN